MRFSIPFLFVTTLTALSTPAQDLLQPETLWQLKRVSGGLLSPDGTTALVSVRSFDLKENSGDSDLWLVPVAGGPAKTLTSGAGTESDAQWVTTPAGVRVFCVAKRDGDPQVYSIDPATGAFTQVSDFPGGVANLKVAPSGNAIAFTAEVKLDATLAETHPDLPKADARILDGLMYRHWDSWHGPAWSHLHVARLGANLKAGPATDVMEGLRVDCPLPPFAGAENFSFSPDGSMIAWTMKLVNNAAESTDANLYVRSVEGEGRSRCLSTGLEGYDIDPFWSPDGKRIGWHSMERAGFEADRNRLLVHTFEDGTVVEYTHGLDMNAHDARFLPDGDGIVFRSETGGTEQLFMILARGTHALTPPTRLTGGRFNHALADVSKDGTTLIVLRQDMIRPAELVAVQLPEGRVRVLSDFNGPAYSKLATPSVEERFIRATDGKSIQAWVIKPPGFDPKRRYPMLTFCQGGPQSQVGQAFSFRWCFHAMAAHGYVVLAPNRRGLPGFGQEWNDEISGDWGGQAMRDILAATDDLLTEPWIDAKRVAAVGASFGGFTTYWLMGNANDRFRAMVSHCGVFNLESMYGTTEELFFANWDLGGPYWKSDGARALYDSFSPHRFVGRWKTPLLVIHGEKDFRVPVNQGMEAFTAAQVNGIPSRFLCFPNEGHWISKPQNSVLWYRVYFDWLDRYCMPKDPR